MPVKWTAERNERFLLLVIAGLKLNYSALAKEWKERYGMSKSLTHSYSLDTDGVLGDVDNFEPSPRAIEEQYKALCKRAGIKKGKSSDATSTPRKAAMTPMVTPKKITAVKTPTSSSKRSRKAMSEDDLSENEGAMASASNGNHTKRTKYDRRSKTPKTYIEEDDEAAADDEAASEDEPGGKFPTPAFGNGGVGDDLFDHDLNLDGTSEKVRGLSFSRNRKMDYDELSDISTFEPEQDMSY